MDKTIIRNRRAVANALAFLVVLGVPWILGNEIFLHKAAYVAYALAFLVGSLWVLIIQFLLIRWFFRWCFGVTKPRPSWRWFFGMKRKTARQSPKAHE